MVPEKFTGKERDSESGLDYFGAKYYGSALGRFTSPDPNPLWHCSRRSPILAVHTPEIDQRPALIRTGNGTRPSIARWFRLRSEACCRREKYPSCCASGNPAACH